ncbi:hypothetical protein QBC38DRAFT_466176 [Podospora fimiseda]|uniref:Uncharacterized protein n=1 Tax=Podospora fimiseda TaxID=252190 RepID=A0AAN7BZ46_9PEZI|nr:hypothetical protein QBC38DRAFT_466176 [Podospora fimiseda]
MKFLCDICQWSWPRRRKEKTPTTLSNSEPIVTKEIQNVSKKTEEQSPLPSPIIHEPDCVIDVEAIFSDTSAPTTISLFFSHVQYAHIYAEQLRANLIQLIDNDGPPFVCNWYLKYEQDADDQKHIKLTIANSDPHADKAVFLPGSSDKSVVFLSSDDAERWERLTGLWKLSPSQSLNVRELVPTIMKAEDFRKVLEASTRVSDIAWSHSVGLGKCSRSYELLKRNFF